MKNNLLLLVAILALVGCQKEFPTAPDYSAQSNVNLTEKWRFDIPQDERVIWVGASGVDRMVYLTNNDAETKLTSYTFSLQGELQSSFVFDQDGVAESAYENDDIRLKSNWISISRTYRNILLNHTDGSFYSAVNSESSLVGSKFDYFLGKENYCYYQTKDSNNRIIAMRWNLTDNSTSVLDTLDTNVPYNFPKYTLLGEYDVELFLGHDVKLVYSKQEVNQGLGTLDYGLVGFVFDDFRGKSSWSRENLLHLTRSGSTYTSSETEGGLVFSIFGKHLVCFDLQNRAVKWKIEFDDYANSNITIGDSELCIVADNHVLSVNKFSGEVNWRKGLGYSYRRISIENQWLAVNSFREIDNNLQGDYQNQMHILDARSSKELYRSVDPLGTGKEIVNDNKMGIARSVVIHNKVAYTADRKYFMALALN